MIVMMMDTQLVAWIAPQASTLKRRLAFPHASYSQRPYLHATHCHDSIVVY
jgi:hypothetical protein